MKMPNNNDESMNPPPGGVLVTNASDNENVRHCIHCVPVSLDSSGLERATKACLDAAKAFSLGNILLSPTEISLLGVTSLQYAKAIFNVFQAFSKENFKMNIDVFVCDGHMMQVFLNVLEEKAKNLGVLGSQRGDHKSRNIMNDDSALDKALTFGKKERVTLLLIGFRENIEVCIEKIEGYLNRLKTKKSITEEKIVDGFWKHNSEIKKKSKDYEVFITLTNEEICIEGMAEQVFECKDALTDFLNKCDEEERELKRLREISKSVQWSYSDINGTILFDEILKEKIESEIAAGNKQIMIQSGENQYEIDLNKKTIRETNTGLAASLTRENMTGNLG